MAFSVGALKYQLRHLRTITELKAKIQSLWFSSISITHEKKNPMKNSAKPFQYRRKLSEIQNLMEIKS